MSSNKLNDPEADLTTVVLAQVKDAEKELATSQETVVDLKSTVIAGQLSEASPRLSSAIYHKRTKEEIADLARAHRFNKRHEPRLSDYNDAECCGRKCRHCCYSAGSLVYLMRSFFHVTFSITTLWVTALCVAGTIIFTYFRIGADLPLSLVTTGVVFPISFLISFTISRRERVLLDVASLKASALSLYFISREWPPAHLAPPLSEKYSSSTNSEDRMRECLEILLNQIAKYLSHKSSDIYSIYAQFDELQHICEEIRMSDDWIRSVISRAYQYVRYMMNDFERLRSVTDFRTPSVFRAFTYVWLTVFPILFSPYFALINLKVSATNPPYWQGIYAAVISALMLVILYNICEELEDPFDDYGCDDLNMEMVKEPTFLMFHRTRREIHEIRARKRRAKAAKRAQAHPPLLPNIYTMQPKEIDVSSDSSDSNDEGSILGRFVSRRLGLKTRSEPTTSVPEHERGETSESESESKSENDARKKKIKKKRKEVNEISKYDEKKKDK